MHFRHKLGITPGWKPFFLPTPFPFWLASSPSFLFFAHLRGSPSFARLLVRLFDYSGWKRKGNGCYASYFGHFLTGSLEYSSKLGTWESMWHYLYRSLVEVNQQKIRVHRLTGALAKCFHCHDEARPRFMSSQQSLIAYLPLLKIYKSRKWVCVWPSGPWSD